MSSVSYGGINLPFPFHTQFDQAAVYDDVGHTDRIYTKFDIHVQCIINTNYATSISASLPANANPATIMKGIRQTLLTPRMQLQITVGGVDLIPANQGANVGTVDARNGPMPQSCAINQITETTFLVTWHVIAHYWENNTAAAPNTNNAGDNVLFNRWTETVDIDECNYSKITRKGTFTIRSDNFEANPVDVYREQMANLPIPKGCKRISSHYEVAADGLSISYQVVDQEVFIQPPSPAFKAQGKYTETTTPMGRSPNRTAHCEVELTGSKTSLMSDLLGAAMIIAVNKLNTQAQLNSSQIAMMTMGKIEQELWENKVKVQIDCMLTPAVNRARPGRNRQPRQAAARDLISRFTNTRVLSRPTPETKVPPPVSVRGTAIGWVLHAAAYYDPSLLNHKIDERTRQVTPGDEIGTLK